MSKPPRPEPGVAYYAFPTPEFAEARALEATQSLAKAWKITEYRAAELLASPAAYRTEFRSRHPLGWFEAFQQSMARAV